MYFWHICRENDLRALSGKFLRVKVKSLPTGKFRLLGLWMSIAYNLNNLEMISMPLDLGMLQCPLM